MAGVFGSLSDWRIVTVQESENDADAEDIAKVIQVVLAFHKAETAGLIEEGAFGAYEYDEGYYVVEFTSEAYSIDHDSDLMCPI